MNLFRKIFFKIYFLTVKLCLLLFSSKISLERKINNGKINKILFIGNMGIGNMIFFTPALQHLRHIFPDAEITLLYQKGQGEDEVIRETDLVNIFFPVDFVDMKIVDFFEWNHKLFSSAYDLLLCKSYAKYNYFFPPILKIPYRLGHCMSTDKYNSIFNLRVPYPYSWENPQHEIDSALLLVEKLGVEIDRSKYKPLFFIDENSKKNAEELLKRTLEKRDNKKLIGMHVYSGINPVPVQTWKDWSVDDFCSLVEMILARFNNAYIFLFGSHREEKWLKDKFSFDERVIICAGELSLKESAALIGRMDMFVGNDSSLRSIALTQGVKTITIFGPTDDKTLFSWNDESCDIYRKDMECRPCFQYGNFWKDKRADRCEELKCFDIPAEKVFEKVAALLGE